MTVRAAELAARAGALRDGSVQQPVHDRGHARLARARDPAADTRTRRRVRARAWGPRARSMGVSQALKAGSAAFASSRSSPPARRRSPAARRGSFAMQGWSGGVPPHWDASAGDDVWTIEDEEAIEMTRRLSTEEGIFAGTSSGANVVGALRLAEQLDAGDVS